MTDTKRGHYMVDVYGGTIVVDDWLGRLDPDHVTLAWQWQPNVHRCVLPHSCFSRPDFKPWTFPGLALSEAAKRGLLKPVRPCEPAVRRAARVVRFGRTGVAYALRVPEVPGVVFDELEGTIDDELAVTP